MRQRQRPSCACIISDLAPDPVDARHGVEHVGRGVPCEREHLLVGEAIVALAIHRQVSILDS